MSEPETSGGVDPKGSKPEASSPTRRPDGTFLPGTSGNPTGMRKGVREFRRRILELTNNGEELIQSALSDLRNPKAPVAVRNEARRLLIEYAFGKPPQPITGEDGGAIVFDGIIQLIEKMHAAGPQLVETNGQEKKGAAA